MLLLYVQRKITLLSGEPLNNFTIKGNKINPSRNWLVSTNWQPREPISPRASRPQHKFKARLWLCPVGWILFYYWLPSPLSCKVFATSFNWPKELSWNTLIFSATASQLLFPISCPNIFTNLASYHHGPLADSGLLYFKKTKRIFCYWHVWSHFLRRFICILP